MYLVIFILSGITVMLLFYLNSCYIWTYKHKAFRQTQYLMNRLGFARILPMIMLSLGYLDNI